MKAWTKLFALSLDEACLLVEATTLVLAAEIALRIAPTGRLVRGLQQTPPAGTPDGWLHAEYLARFIAAADRRVFGVSSCLRRAIAFGYGCRRRGITVDLRIGVRRDYTGLRAHAWVQLDDGRAFGLTEEPAYLPLSGPSPSLDTLPRQANA